MQIIFVYYQPVILTDKFQICAVKYFLSLFLTILLQNCLSTYGAI